jgi:hypothetical protein
MKAVIGTALVSTVLLSSGCGSGVSKSPTQTFVDSYNSSIPAGAPRAEGADRAVVIRAGRAFCNALDSGASFEQAKRDASLIVSNSEAMDYISTAATDDGSLCPQ